jgi:hypothetical protein
MALAAICGTTLLRHGLINPVGAVPIYSRLVRKTSPRIGYR